MASDLLKPRFNPDGTLNTSGDFFSPGGKPWIAGGGTSGGPVGSYGEPPRLPTDKHDHPGIDVEGLYAGARDRLAAKAEQQRIIGGTAIQRASEEANRALKDSVAGTGVGRSGYVQDSFSGIGTAAIDSTRMLEQGIALEQIQAEAVLSMKEADTQYAEDLRLANWAEEDIRDAREFSQMLFGMQFEASIKKDLMEFQQELDSRFSWGEALGSFLSFAGDAIGVYLAYQTLGASTAVGVGAGVAIAK